MLAAFRQFFSPCDLQERAYAAYSAIVAQARHPVFYQQWQVEDSLDGRFDCIVLHLFLVLQRLEAEAHPDMQAYTRYLLEAFFADMDRSLREMGASDTGVGHRVKRMAQAFYGRRKAYGEAQDETGLREALHRNVYRERPVPGECMASLAAYMGRNRKMLAEQSTESLLQGRIPFTA